jgi:hypothetical protein
MSACAFARDRRWISYTDKKVTRPPLGGFSLDYPKKGGMTIAQNGLVIPFVQTDNKPECNSLRKKIGVRRLTDRCIK